MIAPKIEVINVDTPKRDIIDDQLMISIGSKDNFDIGTPVGSPSKQNGVERLEKAVSKSLSNRVRRKLKETGLELDTVETG